MSEPVFRQLSGSGANGIVAVCDHASNAVPDEIELGIPSALLETHIAYDIGTSGVVERLARRHGIPAHLSCISRLVIDQHREEDSPGLIPETSDGHLIPGNLGANRTSRIYKYYRPYHAALGRFIKAAKPELILSIHSFTPKLETKPEEERPWEIALLYNEDDRAARHAIRLFEEQGCNVGDNQPYSGKELNATMNRHAEKAGIPYCAIEIRNDLIATEAGQSRWAAMISDVANRVELALQSER